MVTIYTYGYMKNVLFMLLLTGGLGMVGLVIPAEVALVPDGCMKKL